jgi:hypothetical protein
MFYTIKYADSHKDTNHMTVSFDKNGNKFVVNVWDGDKHQTVERTEFDRYDDAEIMFQTMCFKHKTIHVHEVEQDWTAADFD